MDAVSEDQQKTNDSGNSSSGTEIVSEEQHCSERKGLKRTQPKKNESGNKKRKYEISASEAETKLEKTDSKEGSSSQQLPRNFLQQFSMAQNSSNISPFQEARDLESDGMNLTAGLTSIDGNISAIMTQLSLAHMQQIASVSELAAAIDEKQREAAEKREQKRNMIKKIKEEHAQLVKERIANEEEVELKKAMLSDLDKRLDVEREKLKERKQKYSDMRKACDDAISIGTSKRTPRRQKNREPAENAAVKTDASHSSPSGSSSLNDTSSTSSNIG